MVVVVGKLQRDLGLAKCAMRRWRTVAALTAAVVKQPFEPDNRASPENRVWEFFSRLGEELFALLKILDGFQNIVTPPSHLSHPHAGEY